MLTVLTLYVVACFSAGFSFMLDFAMGFPSSEKPIESSILFDYSYFLAKKRVAKTFPKFETFDKIQTVIQAQRGGITIEKMLGLCGVCANFWISVLFFTLTQFAIYPLPYFAFPIVSIMVYLLGVVLISHFLLRKYLFA